MDMCATPGQEYELDVCVPAYNEADIILDTVRTLADTLRQSPLSRWRIIVADNGSTDGTADILDCAAVPNVSVLRVSGKGKGRAIRECAAQSDAEVFGFIDADLSASPRHIAEFVALVCEGNDLVIGSRLLDESGVERGWWRTLTSRIFNVLARLLVGVDVVDSQCGLKCMNPRARALLAETMQDTWFLDLELLMLATQRRLRIREYPIKWQEERYGGRKSRLRVVRDGIEAVRVMVALRRTHRHK